MRFATRSASISAQSPRIVTKAAVWNRKTHPVPKPAAENRQKSQTCHQRGLLLCSAATKSAQTEPWWEKDAQPNIQSVNSIQELVDSLAHAGDHLVVVEYYARWCASCRALYPKLCRLMAEHPDVLLLKVEYDDNKQMCKTLGVKSIPLFQFYKGAQGRVDSFTCSLARIQKLKDAMEIHNAPFCSLQPVTGMEEFPDVVPLPSEGFAAQAAVSGADSRESVSSPIVVLRSHPVDFLRQAVA